MKSHAINADQTTRGLPVQEISISNKISRKRATEKKKKSYHRICEQSRPGPACATTNIPIQRLDGTTQYLFSGIPSHMKLNNFMSVVWFCNLS